MSAQLDIDEQVLADAEKVARDTNRTISQVVEDVLREWLTRDIDKGSPRRPLPTFGGDGVHSGVDLSNNAALQDLMDEYDGFTGR